MRKNTFQWIACIAFTVCLSSHYSAFTQKVKYKTLFPVLQSKDYVTAEPLLLSYLQDTQDEANPYFYLGEILAGKLDSAKIFPTATTYDSIAGKAVSAYKNAIALVDEKEVRKNDEFYMAYNRRDLRTGKFGIKISDIHLDYEEKIAAVLKRKELVAQIHRQRSTIDSINALLNSKVQNIISNFPDEQSFYFRSTPEDHQTIKLIISDYTTLKVAVESYVVKIQSLNNKLYNPLMEEVSLVEWKNLKPQKLALDNQVISWFVLDDFLEKKMIRITNEISPLKALLEKTDDALNNTILIHQNLSDSSQIKQDSLPLSLIRQLKQFDANSLPLQVLEFKQLKSQSAILANEQLFPVLKDSSNVFQRFKALSLHKLKLEEMLTKINKVQQSANEKVLSDFSFYFERLKPSFDGYFDTEKTVAQKQLENVSQLCLQLESASEFFKYKKDTIYLTKEIAELNSSQKAIDTLIEKSDELVIAGAIGSFPFVAKAAFDMQITQLFKLDTAASFHQLIEIQQNYLFISKKETESNFSQTIIFLSPKLEKLWSYKFTSSSLVHSAKVEAGIFFIYNADGEVLKTLNSSGKEIGN